MSMLRGATVGVVSPSHTGQTIAKDASAPESEGSKGGSLCKLSMHTSINQDRSDAFGRAKAMFDQFFDILNVGTCEFGSRKWKKFATQSFC